MMTKTVIKQMMMLFCLSVSVSVYASAGHDHGHHDDHETKPYTDGPEGGKLFTEGDFSFEILIVEQGIPPEMRLFAYDKGHPVAPERFMANIVLERLGAQANQLQFSPEGNYLVSNQEITEPHSFDIDIEAYYQGQRYHWHVESHEGRTQITDRLLALTGIKTEPAIAQTLSFKNTLFGVIAAPQNQVFRIHAPYAGIVKSVHVQVGDKVTKGQTLLTVRNNQTLQNYRIVSPANGEVTESRVNLGDFANEQALIVVTDLSSVWVELSAFPETIERLAIGQAVTVYDLHQHEAVESRIHYIAPTMTGGHIARARAVLANPEGHWRPGMHIKADVELSQRTVPLAVRRSAIQTVRDKPVVFAKYGNTFEVRILELGESDGDFVEVLSGLKPKTDYVIENSFILKADILKDGASHHH